MVVVIQSLLLVCRLELNPYVSFETEVVVYFLVMYWCLVELLLGCMY